MLYIDKVSKIDGPFTTASVNINQNEAARLKLNKSSSEENLISDQLNYKRITLNAGDGIIFDTNCPHFACPVEKNGERRVIRFDFQKMEWNDHLESVGRRLLKRLNAQIV